MVNVRPAMKPIEGYRLITSEQLTWRPSNLMRIPNADYLERTGSEILGARLWRLPPKSANTLHKHVRAEEFYFVVDGIGRMRVGEETMTIPRLGGVLVGPSVPRLFSMTPIRKFFGSWWEHQRRNSSRTKSEI